jgi:hypothetical protein
MLSGKVAGVFILKRPGLFSYNVCIRRHIKVKVLGLMKKGKELSGQIRLANLSGAGDQDHFCGQVFLDPGKDRTFHLDYLKLHLIIVETFLKHGLK